MNWQRLASAKVHPPPYYHASAAAGVGGDRSANNLRDNNHTMFSSSRDNNTLYQGGGGGGGNYLTSSSSPRYDFHKYEALEGSVEMEDITNDKDNAVVLRGLHYGALSKINLQENRSPLPLQTHLDHNKEFCPTTAKEMGWLGYCAGKSIKLNVLNIKNSNLGDWSGIIEPFCNGLSQNNSIGMIEFHSVDLSGGDIFGMMLPFFQHNTRLHAIAIQDCNNFGAEGCRLFSVALSSCATKTLEDVIISDAGLGDGQIVDIILALSMHPCLVSVSFCGNIMERNACMALSTLIQWTTTELLDLELDGNAIGDEGMELLVTGLSSSASLDMLRLGNNGITSIGIEALSNVLKSPNSQLSHLVLNYNSFGDNGANILASSLANNVSLKILYLFRCNITDEGWKAFAKLICDSSSVNKTHLSNHTLFELGIGKSRNHSSLFTRDVTPFLNYNKEGAKEKVAVKKIIKAHQNISMHPFFEWDLKVLPVAVKWFDNAISTANSTSTIQQRKLSAIYQFIRGNPLLYIKGCSKRELSELQHKDMMVQQEKMMLEAKLRALVIREDRIQARKTACIHRLSGH